MKKKIAIGSALGLTTLIIGGIIWKIRDMSMWKEIEESLPFPRAKYFGDK